MSELTAWEKVRDLISSYPKPPIRCRVVEFQAEERVRSAQVIHDGYQSWYIDDGTRTELSTGRSTVFIQDGRPKRMSGGVHANAWVKSLIQGRLIAYLYDASGRVIETDSVNGRPCWVAEITGLRRDENVTFRFWIDEASGILLRETRLDQPSHTIEVEEPAIGELPPGRSPRPSRPPGFNRRASPGTYVTWFEKATDEPNEDS